MFIWRSHTGRVMPAIVALVLLAGCSGGGTRSDLAPTPKGSSGDNKPITLHCSDAMGGLLPPAQGSFRIGPLTFSVASTAKPIDLQKYPTVSMAGAEYRFMKVVLYVDPGVRAEQITLTKPTDAWLYYTSWSAWQNHESLQPVEQNATKRIKVESCARQRVGYPGGIIIAAHQCLSFRAAEANRPATIARLRLGSRDC